VSSAGQFGLQAQCPDACRDINRRTTGGVIFQGGIFHINKEMAEIGMLYRDGELRKTTVVMEVAVSEAFLKSAAASVGGLA
jgi:hypothetical protein